MEIQHIRSLFPYIKTGKVYFNHASISPLSSVVTDKIKDYLAMRSETDIENFEYVLAVTAEVKGKIASLIHTTADRVAFVDNTSNGLNILAQGLHWKYGDRIVLNDIEFPSNVYPFLNLKTQGVEIDFVKSRDGIVSADDILRAVTPKTKLISLSFVQFLSAYRADLMKIGEYCAKHNIVFCVDGIQGIGALELDVNKYHIDFVACGTQKWMMGLMGLAFVYISDKLQESLAPRYVGWMSVENTWELLNYDFVLKKTADAFQNGSYSVIGVVGVSGALEVFEKIGYKKIEQIILANSRYFINRLHETGYTIPAYRTGTENLSGIISFPSEKAKLMYQQLKDNNIICSLREGMIRFSPHFYNTIEEIEKTIDIIKHI